MRGTRCPVHTGRYPLRVTHAVRSQGSTSAAHGLHPDRCGRGVLFWQDRGGGRGVVLSLGVIAFLSCFAFLLFDRPRVSSHLARPSQFSVEAVQCLSPRMEAGTVADCRLHQLLILWQICPPTSFCKDMLFDFSRPSNSSGFCWVLAVLIIKATVQDMVKSMPEHMKEG